MTNSKADHLGALGMIVEELSAARLALIHRLHFVAELSDQAMKLMQGIHEIQAFTIVPRKALSSR